MKHLCALEPPTPPPPSPTKKDCRQFGIVSGTDVLKTWLQNRSGRSGRRAGFFIGSGASDSEANVFGTG